MNLRSILLQNVFSHEMTHLQVPERGVVLITGPNGAGKSSLIEAPCVALFGKTLRGSPPWNGPGKVEVVTDVVTAERTRAKEKTTLFWSSEVGREARVDFENTTKAQVALERLTGSFEVWRRSRVFSSSDASHFSLATDGERKRLLETVLGIERFDRAHESVRGTLRTLAPRSFVVEKDLARVEGQMDEVTRRLAAARNRANEVGPPPSQTALESAQRESARQAEFIDRNKREVADIDAQIREAERSVGSLSGEALAATQRLAKLGNAPICGTCGQNVDPVLRDTLAGLVAAERSELARRQHVARERVEAMARCRADLQAEQDALRTAKDSHDRTAQHITAQLQNYQAATGILQECESDLAQLTVEQTRRRQDLAELKREIATMEAVSVVLGLKGVRAHVLGKALGGVEVVANSWLRRLPMEDGRRIQLRLEAYTEKKTGGVSDAIALNIDGAGGGHGYHAASGGERRRVDVALIFGISAMALEATEADSLRRLGEDAPGMATGTLFFDECLDTLDEAGKEAVGAALQRMASDRAILVVSHDPKMRQYLGPVVEWVVNQGKVTVK